MRFSLASADKTPVVAFRWPIIGLLACMAVSTLAVTPRSTIVTPRRPDASAGSSLTYENCGLCHKVAPGLSHPTGMIPTAALPEYFPLVNGRVGCTTCHDPGTTPSSSNSGTGHHATLRGTGLTAEICTECHRDASGIAMHRTSGRAHLRWNSGRTRSSTLMAGIDAESRNCLACHDGLIAREVDGGRTRSADSHEGLHSPGLAYRDGTVPGNNGIQLTLRMALDSRIRLFNDTVGCGSCHSPYSSHPRQLVIPNDRSALCFGCHRM